MAQCTTCDDLLCAPCYYAHLRSKPSKSHKVKILVDDIPASYNKRKGTQTEKPKMRPNTAKALSSNVKCKRYMGINLSQFKLFMNGLQGKFYKSYKLAPEDQLCLFFNKVKTNACVSILTLMIKRCLLYSVIWLTFCMISPRNICIGLLDVKLMRRCQSHLGMVVPFNEFKVQVF